MGISDSLKKLAGDAAAAMEEGATKAGKAVQDALDSPRGQAIRDAAQDVAGKAAAAAGEVADRVTPTVRAAVDKATPVVQEAAQKAATVTRGVVDRAAPVVQQTAEKAAAAAKDLADKAVPAVQEAAEKAVDAVKDVASKAEPTVRHAVEDVSSGAQDLAYSAARSAGATARKASKAAGVAVRDTVTKVAADNAAAMEVASARPHTVTNKQTKQKVTVEAYILGPHGEHDYDAVYPKGALSNYGPVGNKAIGALLVMAGIPMLVLPGPGVATIGAGLYFLRKGKKQAGPDDERDDEILEAEFEQIFDDADANTDDGDANTDDDSDNKDVGD